MGLDAGFTAPGIAVVEIPSSLDLARSRLLHVQCVITERAKTRSSISADDSRRVREIVDVLDGVVARFKPNLAVVELAVGGARSAHAIKGMALGTAMTVATLHLLKIDTAILTPANNKRGSTGNWKASKDEVIAAVHRIWDDIPWPRKKRKSRAEEPDEIQQMAIADALSTVISYCGMEKSHQKLVLHHYEQQPI